MPSNTAWARSVNTTIINHLRDEAIEVLRATKIGAMMEAAGRLTTDVSGLGFDWPVQFRLHPLLAVTTVLAPNFTPQNLWKRGVLETRGYQITDAITKKESLENRGREAIVKIAERFGPRLITSLKQQFGREYYVDGNATGNENRIHGLESFFGINGTVDLSTADNVSRSSNAADIVGYPTDTYAGINTTLQDAGGAANGTIVASGTSLVQALESHWPNGDVDPEYDFWSPVIINYTSTSFAGTTHDWKNQGFEAMRFGLLQLLRNMSPEGKSTPMILISRNMYKDTLVQLDTTQRSLVSSDTGLRAYGFKDVFNFDGAEVSQDYYVPNRTGYGLDIEALEMMSMQDDLFKTNGMFWDDNTQSYKIIADFLGNMKAESPRNFFKLQAIA